MAALSKILHSMTCKVILLLVVAGCLCVACEKKKEEQLPKFASWNIEALKKVDESFLRRFDKYWLARSKLDWPIIYTLEAPHVRWAYSDTDFYRRFGRAGKVVKVTVLDIDRPHPKVVDASLKVVFENPFNGRVDTMYPKDRWVEVDGHWFHVWKLTLLNKFI